MRRLLCLVVLSACGGESSDITAFDARPADARPIDAALTGDATPGADAASAADGGQDAAGAGLDARPVDARPADARPVDAAPGDAPLSCGNGVVDTGETCDLGIAGGAGSCPTSCDDEVACTVDALVAAGTCQAACIHDDEACAPEVTGFRIDTLFLRDPHAFILNCVDLTDGDSALSVEGIIRANLTGDDDDDGLLDLSPVLVFKPLEAEGAGSTEGEIVFADCTFPAATTECTGTPVSPRYEATLTNQTAGQCLGIVAGTESSGAVYAEPYEPISPVSAGANACFSSNGQTIVIDIPPLSLTLEDARVAAIYGPDPVTGLAGGLLRGFISEDDADATMIPLPLLGDTPLSELLWGGDGNGCSDAGSPDGDLDEGPGGVPGWYFYLEFTAERVPYGEAPAISP